MAKSKYEKWKVRVLMEYRNEGLSQAIDMLDMAIKRIIVDGNRFINAKFGCNWKDASDDCNRTLNQINEIIDGKKD